ncbi:MAG: tRNA-dihydrouridine synthase family protein [Lachnospiraceae bacterium]|nr:tRNA-dihydrouridine synthase family protein [Lachnospiraceae bacterium]
MKFYFAPFEGITGYLYRNAYHELFDCGIDKYFTPFIAVSQNGLTKSRELEDLSPEHNRGMTVVPQLLGNNGEQVNHYLHRLREMGYEEVNLNMGCPYQTVVHKRKGAGLLADTDLLKEFLEEAFCNPPVKVSIKTRIGMENGEEFAEILDIYNQYPVSELIVHPRVREDFYKNHPDLDVFASAMEKSRAPVCYNGDIFTLQDFQTITARFPKLERIMLGRGLLTNPGLLSEIIMGKSIDKEELKVFHDRVFHDYAQIMSGDKNTLFKMKELWNYFQFLFDNREKCLKKIRKAKTFADYECAVDNLFARCPFMRNAAFFIPASNESGGYVCKSSE